MSRTRKTLGFTAPRVGIGCCVVAVALATAGARPSLADEDLAVRVERAAARAAGEHVAAPDRLELLSSRFGGADPVRAESIRLELAEIEGPNAAGFLRVRFRMLDGDVPRGEARATVRGRVRGPVLTAARTLGRDRILAEDDVRVEDVDLTRVIGKPLRAPQEALGRVPVRSLGQGRVLTEELIGPAPVVQRGQDVELRFENDQMSLTAPGTALRRGVPGEVVPAENSVTGVRVEGIVQPDGSLIVNRRAGSGRF